VAGTLLVRGVLCALKDGDSAGCRREKTPARTPGLEGANRKDFAYLV
jgi:hypothetical protein